jgi:aminoglycoside phosphotransferase (APT) family kinase protein
MPLHDPASDPVTSTGEIRERTLLGEGGEAETLAWGEGRVLRLLKDPAHADRLTRERAALAAARAAGAPVPRDYGPHSVAGRPGLVLERIDGPDLLTLLAQRPWLLPRIARILGETHAKLHAAVVPDGLPTVPDIIRQALTESELVPPRFAAAALKRLEQLSIGDTLCHWDFQPTNVILSATGPRIIDWSFAARGHPAADVARTRLILAIGEPPPSAGFVVRRLDPLGRRALGHLYLIAYAKTRPIDARLVNRWIPLVALPRLTANVPEERDRLVALIGDALSDQGASPVVP